MSVKALRERALLNEDCIATSEPKSLRLSQTFR